MSQPESEDRGHIDGFDYLRIIAVFAVVWIHGSDTSASARRFQELCVFAVPAFILMSAYLGARGFAKRPSLMLKGYIYARVRRLVPSYLAWSLVYLVLRFLKHTFITGSPFSIDWIAVIFSGSASYQLYFIPALLIWAAVFGPAMLFAARTKKKAAVGMALIFLSALFYRVGPGICSGISIPAGYEMIKYMIGDTGYFFLGIGLWGLSEALRTFPVTVGRLSSGVTGLAGIGFSFAGMKLGILQGWYEPLFSSSVFLISLVKGRAENPVIVGRLSECAFGIYLSHAVFIEGFQAMAGLEGIGLGSFPATAGVIIAAFICSSALCVLLRRWKPTKWLVV